MKIEHTVDGDANKVADFFDLATGEMERTEIPKNEMVVGPVSLKLVVVLDKFFCQNASIGNDLLRVQFERRVSSLLQSCSNGRNSLGNIRYSSTGNTRQTLLWGPP